MEKLAALCCLWVFGFGTKAEYSAELDRLFLENPDDDFLLELENIGGDYAAAWARLSPILQTADTDKFGRVLFWVLEKYFLIEKITLREFGIRCCRLWSGLPDSLAYDEPFCVLGYADEPLSWGDEKQSRELFQSMFDYYKNEMG